jgi:hypothetical protein
MSNGDTLNGHTCKGEFRTPYSKPVPKTKEAVSPEATITNVESWCLESKVRLLLFDDSKLKRRGGLEGDLAFIYIRRRISWASGSHASRLVGLCWERSGLLAIPQVVAARDEARVEVYMLGRGS